MAAAGAADEPLRPGPRCPRTRLGQARAQSARRLTLALCGHMSEDRETTPAERAIARSGEDDRGMGPLSQRSLERQRTVEGYLRTGFKPRYMERLQEIHAGIERHRRELAVAYG